MDNKNKPKLIRVATVSGALTTLLKGQLKFLSNHFEVKAVCSPDERFPLIKEQEGVESIPITIKREISPWQDCLSLWKLFCLFRKEKPEIVHSIMPKAGLLSMLAAKLAKVPIRIHTYTGLRFETTTGFLRKLLIFMDKVTCMSATHIIPEGEGVKSILSENKITQDICDVIHFGHIIGINGEYFNPSIYDDGYKQKKRLELSLSKNDLVFCFIGRIVRDKGVNELVEAFCLLNSKYSNSKLLVLGNFEQALDPISDESLVQLETNPNIILCGYHDDIRPFLLISDALVLPSYREGFPTVVLQAGAMNLPSIVTNISGCNEIITHDENGLLVPVSDVNSLYNAMERFLIEPNLKYCLSRNTREKILLKYKNHDINQAHLDFYFNILSDNHRK